MIPPSFADAFYFNEANDKPKGEKPEKEEEKED